MNSPASRQAHVHTLPPTPPAQILQTFRYGNRQRRVLMYESQADTDAAKILQTMALTTEMLGGVLRRHIDCRTIKSLMCRTEIVVRFPLLGDQASTNETWHFTIS